MRVIGQQLLPIPRSQTFGAEYLCYPGDPMQYHAHLLVHVVHPAKRILPIELVAAARMAASVKKIAVLAECVSADSDGNGVVQFITLSSEAAARVVR